MSQPSLFQLRTWDNFKKEIFAVTREALKIMLDKTDLPILEDHPQKHNLNRGLDLCFRQAYRQTNRRLLIELPVYDAKNPPFEEDIEPSPRETKRPDFLWDIMRFLDDGSLLERRFSLECKRLGGLSQKLNQKYVQQGIRRFVSYPHEYGRQEDTCAMIGYVQSMEFDEILREVNTAISNNPEHIPILPQPGNGWQEKGVSELEHQLERPFPVSPFQLHHFWVDLRFNG